MGAEVVPVNPTKTEVDGIPCFASLADVGRHRPRRRARVGAVPVVEQAIGPRRGFAVVFAAGFAEQGAEGRAEQERLARAGAPPATSTCSDPTPT